MLVSQILIKILSSGAPDIWLTLRLRRQAAPPEGFPQEISWPQSRTFATPLSHQATHPPVTPALFIPLSLKCQQS